MKKKPTPRRQAKSEPAPKPDARMERLASEVERSGEVGKGFVAHLRERGLLKGKAK